MAWQVAIAQEAELRRELEARGYELQRVQGCSTIEQVPVLIPALVPALDEMRGELRAAEERCRAESERARRAELRAAIEAERREQAEQLLERERAVRQVLEERHAEALQVHAATHATRTPRARHAHVMQARHACASAPPPSAPPPSAPLQVQREAAAQELRSAMASARLALEQARAEAAQRAAAREHVMKFREAVMTAMMA